MSEEGFTKWVVPFPLDIQDYPALYSVRRKVISYQFNHVPAGATPKNGPSAGVTMLTCHKMKKQLAMMTDEITRRVAARGRHQGKSACFVSRRD